MQPAIPDIEFGEPFNKAFEQINSGAEAAVEAFDDLVNRVRKWSVLLGIPVVLYLKNRLDSARDGLNEVLDRVKHALDHQTPVLSLISTSFQWVTDVKTPVSGLSFATTEPSNQNFAKWSGDAASAHSAKMAKQKAAVDETVVKSEFISQWLFNIAKANVDYAVELAKIVTGLAGKFTQAAVEAGSVIDIPWAVSTLAKSVGDLVTAGLNTLLSIGQRFVDALGNVRDIATQVGDHSKLPGGAWPHAVRG
ncbi:hypothetical protein ACK8GG_14900 [Micromonosporaceae bacterium DT55]|uniref:hypothetical protein n=1 Tax=Melissospora conviva TaxID=3388432 RepID=UPI003C22A88A